MAVGALVVMAGQIRVRRAAKVALGLLAPAGLAATAMANGRGVKIAVAFAVFVACVLCAGPARASRLQRRLPVVVLALGLAVGVYYSVLGDDLAELTHSDRFSEISLESHSGTSWWRLLWWQRLRDDVMAQNPLFGLGFGQSLDVYNPYLVGDEQTKWPVRSPHNFNITVFSRMGIVGAVAWAAILLLGPALLALRLWKGGFAGRKYSPDRREELLLCLIVLVASWGNASFGVLLEGPVLAVPFWFVLGFAMGRSADLRSQAPPMLVSCAS
jgi:O-antigen ligase